MDRKSTPEGEEVKRKEHKQELIIDFKDLPASLRLLFYCIDHSEEIDFYDHKIIVKVDKDKIIDGLKEHFGCEANK